MVFSTVKEQSLWLAYLIISIFFVLLFVFRDTIFYWKEICKAKIRRWIYDKTIETSVVGDTAKTSSISFSNVLFNFLNDHFLKPSDGLPYDYLLYGEYDDDDVDERGVALQYGDESEYGNKNPENDGQDEEIENGDEDYEEEEEEEEEEDEKQGIISLGI